MPPRHTGKLHPERKYGNGFGPWSQRCGVTYKGAERMLEKEVLDNTR